MEIPDRTKPYSQKSHNNCVTPPGNYMTENQNSWKFHMIFFYNLWKFDFSLVAPKSFVEVPYSVGEK